MADAPENLAAVLRAPGEIVLERRPVPEPGPHEVLVAVHAVGICGSDVHYFEHGRIGDYVVEAPLVLGHESAGVVVGRGAAALRHALGTRVALEPGVPCGRCAQCRRGRYNLCPEIAFFATPPVDGALATFVAIDEDFAHRLPDTVSDAAGALMEPLSVALWANRRAGVGPGARVAIAGAGPIGVVAPLVARLAGAGEVVLSDPLPERRARAEALGAGRAVDPAAGGLVAGARDADIFLDCSGAEAAIADGITALGPAGVAVLVGMCPAATVPFPLARIQNRELWVTGTFRYANTYPDAIALVASGRIDLDALVDARFPLEESRAALVAARRDPAVLKPLVEVASPR